MFAAVKRVLSKPVSFKRSEPVRMKVRTRLTPSGWGFLGLIFCSFLMAVNFSNNLIFAMTFLLVSIALVGWYHTRANVGGLVLADWRSTPVFAGQKAIYRLTVENRARNGRHGLKATSRGGADEEERHLAAGEQVEMILHRSAPARGILKSIPVDIRSCFPLGIFEGRMAAGPLPECMVYPTPSGEQPIPDRPVGRQAHLLSESGTYTDMRRYSPGDPLSRISWKALARLDELYTKEFDGAQGQPALWLCWDDVRASGVEQKLSQLCRWVLDAHRQNREYGLEIPGTMIEPASEDAHLRNCLRALALYGESKRES
jgi:uncharacterized protein (DUF58 family)